MSTSWVAASVRARAMARRRVGAAAARALAVQSGFDDALDTLVATPYGHDVRPGQSLAEAQYSVAATLLWHLRVLGGWAPRGDAQILRVLAGGFEVANTEDRLAQLTGAEPGPQFRLGALATAWSRIETATSSVQVRQALAASAWGDPGGDTAAEIHLGMRISWAVRVARTVPQAGRWAGGAAALLAARTVLLAGQKPWPTIIRTATPLLGSTWATARSLRGLAAALPADARWPLAPVDDPDDLWQAEAAWWTNVERGGFALLRRPVTTSAPVIGCAAVLAVDAWRVRAALEVASRGGELRTRALEAFDAMA